MDMVIAEREVLVSTPEGRRFVTKVQFGKPYETEDKGWFCDLEMEGIVKSHYAAGADSLQSLLLTMSLAESILIDKVKNGWQLFYPDTEEVMDINEFFSLSAFISRKN